MFISSHSLGSGSALAGWFWFRVSHKAILKLSTRPAISWRPGRVENSLLRWVATYMADGGSLRSLPHGSLHWAAEHPHGNSLFPPEQVIQKQARKRPWLVLWPTLDHHKPSFLQSFFCYIVPPCSVWEGLWKGVNAQQQGSVGPSGCWLPWETSGCC